MKIITDDVLVYGVLYTTFGKFDLLAPEPERNNLPWYLRGDALSFYVVDEDNWATHVIVKGDYGIKPFPTLKPRKAKFVQEDEPEKIENPLLIRPLVQS